MPRLAVVWSRVEALLHRSEAQANTQAKVYQECSAIVKHAEILLITAIIAKLAGIDIGPAFALVRLLSTENLFSLGIKSVLQTAALPLGYPADRA